METKLGTDKKCPQLEPHRASSLPPDLNTKRKYLCLAPSSSVAVTPKVNRVKPVVVVPQEHIERRHGAPGHGQADWRSEASLGVWDGDNRQIY